MKNQNKNVRKRKVLIKEATSYVNVKVIQTLHSIIPYSLIIITIK